MEERIVLDTEQEYLEQRAVRKRKADHRESGKRSVAVKIGGRDYRIRSDLDEAWLQRVAAAVDEAMRRIRDHTDTVDSLEVAVLTALNLSRELLHLRERVAQLEAGGAETASTRGASPEPGPGDLRELIELVEAELVAGVAAVAGDGGR